MGILRIEEMGRMERCKVAQFTGLLGEMPIVMVVYYSNIHTEKSISIYMYVYIYICMYSVA